MEPRIVIVDYDAGNLRSVERALVHNGADPIVSADSADLDGAAGVVLPGVGAAADTMAKLHARGLEQPLRDYVATERPFLGVCMGLQAFLTESEEGGHQRCLDIVPGRARHFPGDDLKVPHMGWNTVDWAGAHRITEGIESGSYFYFVHSFYPELDDETLALGTTTYGVTFPSVIARDNLVLTQFHPEKSGQAGLRLYRNFVDWVAETSNAAASAARA